MVWRSKSSSLVRIVCTGTLGLILSSIPIAVSSLTKPDSSRTNIVNSSNTPSTPSTCPSMTASTGSTTPPSIRLLLTSSGIATPAMTSAFQELYKQSIADTKRTKIIYIYDALMDPNQEESYGKIDNKHYLIHELQRQMQVGPDVLVPIELRSLSDGQAATLLDDYNASGVYLEQGNTYYLLYQIRRTQLDQSLRTSPGALYVGASAGAIVAGRTIRICQWKNWDNPGHGTWWDVRNLPTGLDGLDLMDGSDGKSLFPHYSPEWDRRIEEMMPKHPEGVVILDEEQFYVQGRGNSDETRAGRVER